MKTLTVTEVWQTKAACRGPQAAVFFPPPHFERRDEKQEREQRAKDICVSCSVRGECLNYAVQIREQHGIWGGTTENERKQMLNPKKRVTAKVG